MPGGVGGGCEGIGWVDEIKLRNKIRLPASPSLHISEGGMRLYKFIPLTREIYLSKMPPLNCHKKKKKKPLNVIRIQLAD